MVSLVTMQPILFCHVDDKFYYKMMTEIFDICHKCQNHLKLLQGVEVKSMELAKFQKSAKLTVSLTRKSYKMRKF